MIGGCHTDNVNAFVLKAFSHIGIDSRTLAGLFLNFVGSCVNDGFVHINQCRNLTIGPIAETLNMRSTAPFDANDSDTQLIPCGGGITIRCKCSVGIRKAQRCCSEHRLFKKLAARNIRHCCDPLGVRRMISIHQNLPSHSVGTRDRDSQPERGLSVRFSAGVVHRPHSTMVRGAAGLSTKRVRL